MLRVFLPTLVLAAKLIPAESWTQRRKWVKKYIAEGESSFIHKGHPGNKFAALHVSKNLSELERLRLMVAKLEIENERLKKGYQVKGAGANKEYVTIQGKNTRS